MESILSAQPIDSKRKGSTYFFTV